MPTMPAAQQREQAEQELKAWAEGHVPDVRDAQERYDAERIS